MRRLVILGGVVLAFGVGALAQSVVVFPFQNPQVLPELQPPCQAIDVRPVVIPGHTATEDATVFGIWHCTDGRFLPVRYATVTVDTPSPTNQPTACPGLAPRPGWVCIQGGWRDPVTVR